MKKIFAGLLALIVLVIALAQCAGRNPSACTSSIMEMNGHAYADQGEYPAPEGHAEHPDGIFSVNSGGIEGWWQNGHLYLRAPEMDAARCAGSNNHQNDWVRTLDALQKNGQLPSMILFCFALVCGFIVLGAIMKRLSR